MTYRWNIRTLRYEPYTISQLKPAMAIGCDVGAAALIYPAVRRLVSLMRNDSLRILQVHHASLGCRLVRCHQVIQKLTQLSVIRHVATKDQAAIFVNHEERVGPGP